MGDHGMRSRLYAGKPVNPLLLANQMTGSDNVRGAENQQERLDAYSVENPQRPYADRLS